MTSGRSSAALVASVSAATVLLTSCGGTSEVAGASAASTTSSAAASASSTTAAPSPTTRVTPTPTTTTAAASTRPAAPAATPTRTRATAVGGAQALAPVPRAGAEPAVRFPRNPPAEGGGANAVVTPVPDALWSRMTGYSWTPGCPVGRSGLRQVSVNFWGFDGKRSRGAVVVNRAIAQQTAAAFTRLYDLRFRIRQMRPMDSGWGKHPKGPGADDYASMDADNTSAFNCRYVGGEEEKEVYSRHAYGMALDVNPFENPYLAPDGSVYPDDHWARRRGPAPGVFSSASSAPVRAFTSQGLGWGGLWTNPDYQHFDAR